MGGRSGVRSFGATVNGGGLGVRKVYSSYKQSRVNSYSQSSYSCTRLINTMVYCETLSVAIVEADT